MLRSLKDLERYTVSATDGDVGNVVNFFIDDERWAVRYLIVESHGFMDGRRTLISPISFGKADWSTKRFNVTLTKDKVRNSPLIDTDKPVSRQHERELNRYYGYPFYWGFSGLWGMGAFPGLLAARQWTDVAAKEDADAGDVHLRSANEVRGYHVQGNDAAIGHVHDFVVDDETWQVRYLVIDTSNWWLGKKVLIAPRSTKRIEWPERKIFVDMSRQAIKESPQWKETAP
jgi:sporulation protein YlmC with PRC-barrel domain